MRSWAEHHQVCLLVTDQHRKALSWMARIKLDEGCIYCLERFQAKMPAAICINGRCHRHLKGSSAKDREISSAALFKSIGNGMSRSSFPGPIPVPKPSSGRDLLTRGLGTRRSGTVTPP